jgi:serine/threonine protein kinase
VTDSRASSGTDFAPGDTVGPYKITANLGVGGMGRVFRADGPGGEQVALKLVKVDLARDVIFRKRFAREARIAQQISHPNLVPVLDTGEHNGIPYLTQRFIPGGSLADQIEARGKLEIETAVGVCGQVAGALDSLHGSGLVHRDVKPANILIDEQGVSHITDFGLAKDTQGSLLTRPGQAVGSLDYMAPEQIRGEQVGAATDVYALGCVMFECICGAPPFADRQGMRVLWAHLQDPAPDPRQRRADLSAEMSAALLEALVKDASERPPTASAYARRLEQAAGLAPA